MASKITVAGRENTFKLPTAGQHIGDIVAWNLRKVVVDERTLKSLADANGVSHDALPKMPSHALTFSRVAKRPTIAPKGVLVRAIHGTEGNVSAFAIVEETYDGAGRRVGHQQIATIEYDTKSDAISIDASGSSKGAEVAQAIREVYGAETDKCTTLDVSQWLADTLKGACRGFVMRENGGLYWVTAEHAEELRALKKLVEGLTTNQGRAEFNLIPVHDSDEALEAAQRAARDALTEEIRALAEEIDGFNDRTQKRTLEDRIEAADELAARADLYHSTLKMMADDLLGQIGGMRDNIDRMLSGRPLKPVREHRGRDTRLPPKGTVLTAKYKGHAIEAVEADDGTFTCTVDGQQAMDGDAPFKFRTLSGVGQWAVGHAVNGYLLFGLGSDEPVATPAPEPTIETTETEPGHLETTVEFQPAQVPANDPAPDAQTVPTVATPMTDFGRSILMVIGDNDGSATAKTIATTLGKSTVNVLNSAKKLVASGLVSVSGASDDAVLALLPTGWTEFNTSN
jgi:hypothetical protein